MIEFLVIVLAAILIMIVLPLLVLAFLYSAGAKVDEESDYYGDR